MKAHHTVFVKDTDDIEGFLQSLKMMPCPFCGKRGTLNRHSLLKGNDPLCPKGTTNRGQRAYCSTRNHRGGCGRTFAILFAWIMPRHTLTAPILWKCLTKWLTGSSIRSSWIAGGSPMILDSFYHLLQRLRRRMDAVRTALQTLAAAPASHSADPLLQTVEHLKRVFTPHACPPEGFQLRFQRPLMG